MKNKLGWKALKNKKTKSISKIKKEEWLADQALLVKQSKQYAE